jgi:DNA polymerase III alpha subunit (gram-positive type)
MGEVKDFVAVKLESTELKTDIEVLAFKAVRFRQGQATERFIKYVKYEGELTREIFERTGISYEDLDEEGVSENQAYKEFFSFIGNDVIVTNNMAFYRAFINKHNTKIIKTKDERKEEQEKFFFDDDHKKISTQWLAQSLYLGVEDYEISTLLRYFEIEYDVEDPVGEVEAIGKLLLKLETSMKEQNKTLNI